MWILEWIGHQWELRRQKSFQNKKICWAFLRIFEAANLSSVELGMKEKLSPTAQIYGSHPINEAEPGVGHYWDINAIINWLKVEFTRQNYIVLAGQYQDSESAASMGYFVSYFKNHCSELLQVIKWRFYV